MTANHSQFKSATKLGNSRSGSISFNESSLAKQLASPHFRHLLANISECEEERYAEMIEALRLHRGINDGTRWAKYFATPAMINNLNNAVDRSPNVLDFVLRCISAWHSYANRLVGVLLAEESDKYITEVEHDPDGMPILTGIETLLMDSASDSAEFRAFWQPFISKPMETYGIYDVVDSEGSIGRTLSDTSYLKGFIIGAYSHVNPEMFDLRDCE